MLMMRANKPWVGIRLTEHGKADENSRVALLVAPITPVRCTLSPRHPLTRDQSNAF